MVAFILLAAVDEQHGLSKENKIPWCSSTDQAYFKGKISNQKAILTAKTAKAMGIYMQIHKTELWSEIQFKDVKLHVSLVHADTNYQSYMCESTIYVLGGSKLYEHVLTNYPCIVYLSHITGNYQCDNFFPLHLLQKYYITDKYVDNLLISKYTKLPSFDFVYKKLLQTLLVKQVRSERTGTGTHALFDYSFHLDLSAQFPLLQLKKTSFEMIYKELLFFIAGKCDANILAAQNCHIWNANCTQETLAKLKLPYQAGDMGPMYPHQWRHAGSNYIDNTHMYTGVDQLQELINNLQTNPHSRRHLLVNWDAGQLNKMVLPPCHVLAQFYVEDNYLDCTVYQRSCDVFLGLPFNVASYACLQHMIAQLCHYQVRFLHFHLGDTHLYANHVGQAYKVLSRELPTSKPQLQLFNRDTIDKFTLNDWVLSDYSPHDAIKAQMSV